MMLLSRVCLIALSSFSIHAAAQVADSKVCDTDEMLQEQSLLGGPIRDFVRKFLRSSDVPPKTESVAQNDSLISVPVVFHVVYHFDEQNVTDARIADQIQRLNDDFAGLNLNSMGEFSPALRADAKIRFQLASVAPDGSATTGIERRLSPFSVFGSNTGRGQMLEFLTGGMDPWDPNYYLNIWIAPTSTIQGYTLAFTDGSSTSFGVVIHPESISGGSRQYSSNGSMLTHEIGHCLGLRHTWGDDQGACSGSDLCGDTPNSGDHALSAFIGIKTLPGIQLLDPCASSAPGVMYMNFMDYCTDGSCANFTPDQVKRMRSTLTSGGMNERLAVSDRSGSPSGCTVPSKLYVTNINIDSARFVFGPIAEATSYNVRYRPVDVDSWTSFESVYSIVTLTVLVPETTYEVTVQASTPNCISAFAYPIIFRTPRQSSPDTLTRPLILSPTLGSTVNYTRVLFAWSSVDNASSYIVQWSTDSLFERSPTHRVLLSSTTVDDLLPRTRYYWRVQACADGIESDWSNNGVFITHGDGLLPPPLLSPPDHSAYLSPDVDLDWEENSNTGYDVEYATNIDFTNSMRLYRSTSVAPHVVFQDGTTYYWRVRSRNGMITSDWTDTWTFTTAPYSLRPPRLLLPGNNAHEHPLGSPFVWSVRPDATGYTLELNATPTFDGPTSFSTSDTAFVISDLAHSNTYHWRVRSFNAVDTSEWSPTYWFTTVGTATSVSRPHVISPANGLRHVSRSPLLRWTETPSANGYELVYGASATLQDGRSMHVESSIATVGALRANTTYYWKVRAQFKSGDLSDWGGIWSFATDDTGDEYNREHSAVSIACSPHPIVNNANIIIHNVPDQNFSISVFNAYGELVYASKIRATGMRSYSVNVSTESWGTGLYVVGYVSENEVCSYPLMITR